MPRAALSVLWFSPISHCEREYYDDDHECRPTWREPSEAVLELQSLRLVLINFAYALFASRPSRAWQPLVFVKETHS